MKNKTLILSGIVLLGLLLTGCASLFNQNSGGRGDIGDPVHLSPVDPDALPPEWSPEVRIEGDYRHGELVVGYSSEGAAYEAAALVGGSVVDRIPELQVAKLSVPGGVAKSMATILQGLRKGSISGIRFVEPNYMPEMVEPIRTDRSVVAELGPTVYDPTADLRPYQWGLDMVNAEAAWTRATGQGVLVAVLDTGVDGTHPDLDGQVEPQWFDGRAGEWVTGIDSDVHGHGTHVAGIIAAKNDGVGITGLAPEARILSVRIFDPGSVGTFNIAQAVIAAVDYGADVLNNSWGGKFFSQLMQAAVAYALDNGRVFVVSMGNSSMDEIMFPGAYPGAIGVGATNPDDRKTGFSTMGGYISVSAPGDRILSSVPTFYVQDGTGINHLYEYWGGTSMSAPFVSALAAMVLERHPGATPYQVRRIMEHTAEDIEAPGFDRRTGYGRIDAAAASSVTSLPADGGHVQVHVTTESQIGGPAGLYFVDVMLRKNGVDRYFGQTDVLGWQEFGYPTGPLGFFGAAPFHGIEPGTYQVLVGGEDSYINWGRVANRVTATGTVTVGSGGAQTVTLALNTELEVSVNFADNVGAKLAVWEGDFSATGWSVWESPPASADWGTWSGTATQQVYTLDDPHIDWEIYYLAIDATAATADTTATVTVIQNGVSEVYGPYVVEAGGFYPSEVWPDWWDDLEGPLVY